MIGKTLGHYRIGEQLGRGGFPRGKETDAMRFECRVWKDKGSRFWLAEAPLLDLMTQGTSKSNACRMIADAIESLIDRKGFHVDVRQLSGELFTVGLSKT